MGLIGPSATLVGLMVSFKMRNKVVVFFVFFLMTWQLSSNVNPLQAQSVNFTSKVSLGPWPPRGNTISHMVEVIADSYSMG